MACAVEGWSAEQTAHGHRSDEHHPAGPGPALHASGPVTEGRPGRRRR